MIGTKGTRMDGQALNLPRKEGTDGPHRTFPVLKAFHPFLKTAATTKFTKTTEMNLEKGSPVVEETLVCVHAPPSTPERVKGGKILKQQIYVSDNLFF